MHNFNKQIRKYPRGFSQIMGFFSNEIKVNKVNLSSLSPISQLQGKLASEHELGILRAHAHAGLSRYVIEEPSCDIKVSSSSPLTLPANNTISKVPLVIKTTLANSTLVSNICWSPLMRLVHHNTIFDMYHQ